MTGHIISPWLFYAVEIASDAELVLFIAVMCFVAAFVFMLFLCDEDAKFGRFLKPLFAGLVVSVVLLTVIPSEETIYKMVAADFVTYENVEKGGEAIKEMFDYVVDKVKENDDG